MRTELRKCAIDSIEKKAERYEKGKNEEGRLTKSILEQNILPKINHSSSVTSNEKSTSLFYTDLEEDLINLSRYNGLYGQTTC